MKKLFFKKKKEEMDYTIISTISDKINEFETELVDIHCCLSNSIDDLNEFRILQEKLDTLTTKFYANKGLFEEMFGNLQRRFERYESILKNNALLAIWALIIPYIGFILGLTIEGLNLLYLKKVKDDLKVLEQFSNQVDDKFNIIQKNIEIRYDSLNKKLKEYADKQNRVELDYEDDYTFYYANQILTSYLDGHDKDMSDIDPKILLALKCLLQQELQTDNEDLQELLNCAAKRHSECVSEVKQLNYNKKP